MCPGWGSSQVAKGKNKEEKGAFFYLPSIECLLWMGGSNGAVGRENGTESLSLVFFCTVIGEVRRRIKARLESRQGSWF